MVIQTAKRLGLLQSQLGIQPESRVSYSFTSIGVTIWDWTAGAMYVVASGRFEKSKCTVPERVRGILSANDAELKRRWDDGEGWDEEREAIFSELCERGVNMLPGH
jgi:hypothetical protein